MLSLVLHLLVLAAFADLPAVRSSGDAPPEPLHVSVRVLPEIGEARKGEESHVARPQRAKPQGIVAQPTPWQERAVPPAPTIRSESAPGGTSPFPPAPIFVAADPAVERMPVSPVPGGIPQQRAAPTPATVAIAAPEEVPGPDAAGLRQFRLALASEARRVRHYPEAARRVGLAGTAEIRISVNALAQRQAELAHSSGHAMLDAAALEMMRIAAERSPLPDVLRGQAFVVSVPVVFEVEE